MVNQLKPTLRLVVLSNVSETWNHPSLSQITKEMFGKMIELGKRDLITHGNLDLQPFLLNRVYCGIDLIHVGEKRPDILERIREECLEWYSQGRIAPIRPLTIFPASDISLAFRHMQQ